MFKQLGQARPPTAGTAVTLYTVPASTAAVAMRMYVCNQTGSASTFRIFQDDSGGSSTTAEALYYDVPIAANDTKILQIPNFSTSGGTITVASGNNNAVTFTLGGFEVIDPVHKILAQSAPASTTAATLYTITAGSTVVNMEMVIVNTGATDETYRLYQDDEGDASGSSNHVAWQIPILAQSRQSVKLLPMNTTGGIVGVRTSNADDLTFTLSGTII